MATLLDAPCLRVAHLRAKLGLINGLRLLWVAAVLWFEVGAFLWSLLGCRWPDKSLSSKASATHILLIADPQVLDGRSYPGRPQWLMGLTQYIVDFNLRKSWSAVFTRFNPHMVIFMGDMMDNGRSNLDENGYIRSYDRFKSIFCLDASVPVHYMPGNHDVDLGYSAGLSSRARDRYKAHFGAMNQRIDIANHTLVLFDAPGLVDEDYRRHTAKVGFQDWRSSKGGAVEFLKNVTQHRPSGPIVLFSHIPLSRSDRLSCGPLREKGTIHPGVGKGYQNLLLRETSAFILENVRPALIFSGDDHDYCEYNHHLEDGSTVREVTVKSFSMAMGIRRPGFQLLSLGNTAQTPYALPPSTLADTPCLLPDQIKLYTHGYAPLAIVTAIVLLVVNFRYPRLRRSSRSLSRAWTDKGAQAPASPGFFSPTTVKPPASAMTRRQSPSRAEESQRGISELLSPTGRPGAPPLAADGDVESQESSGMSRSLPESHFPRAELQDDYPLASLSARATSSPERERAPWSPKSPLELLGLAQRLACCKRWTRGGGQHSRYGRALRDLFQVAWPALWVYFILNLWSFWR